MPTHLEQKLGPISIAVAAGMYATIFLTYGLCVSQGHCEKFLPSISGTWVWFPETNISRFVVGNVAMAMGALQFAVYWCDTDVLSVEWNKILTTLGFIACFGLAGVGAVCDDSGSKDCRGNGTIHVAVAAVFFTGYNIQMIVRTLLVKKMSFELTIAGASLLTKLRFFPSFVELSGWQGFPTGNVIEWVDVALICIWSAAYVSSRGGSLRLCILDRAPKGSVDPAPLAPFWSMRILANIGIGLYAGTIATSAIIYKSAGRWPKNGWPFISDMWVYPAGNWISRYGAVAGGTLCAFCHLCAYYLRKDGGGKGSSGWMTALACVAMLGVEVVGCVDESENGTIHGIAAGTFFAGYDVFMILTAVEMMSHYGFTSTTGAAALATITSLLCKVRFLREFVAVSPAALAPTVGWGPNDFAAVLEWTDAAVIAVFFAAYVGAEGQAASDVGIAVIRMQSQEQDEEHVKSQPDVEQLC